MTLPTTIPTGGTQDVQPAYVPAPICFLRGTQIMTRAGEVAVEALRPGDEVRVRGGFRAVRWIGCQSFSSPALRGRPGEGGNRMPVRIRAGALSDNVPCRDLLVSPEHSLLLNGHLALARDLLNGASIVQDDMVGEVEYYHIDLGVHDCVLADGAWAESYAEQLNRHRFDNFAAFAAEQPDALPRFEPFCAPQLLAGDAALADIHAALLVRAAMLPAARVCQEQIEAPDRLQLIVCAGDSRLRLIQSTPIAR